MTYKAPTRDILFNIEHLSEWQRVTDLPQYASLDMEDVAAVLEEYGRFCADKIAPLNASGDLAGSHLIDGSVVLPKGFADAYAQFVEMGWQSLRHPEDYGGQGLPRAVGAAATEILNAANMSFALCPLLTDGAIEALLTAGSEAQKAIYLEKLISGTWTGTMNLTEPQAGSDLALVRTRATPQQDGTYAINGTKIFITYGEHDMADNIIHLVLARTPDAPDGVRGISLFVVPKKLVSSDGTLGEHNKVQCLSLEHKLGIKASPTALLEFDEATGFLIGEENSGLDYMFVMMNAARFAVGLQGVAIAERAYQLALSYAKERVQSSPADRSSKEAVTIIHHPDVRRLLLRMRALTEGSRALATAAAGWQDLSHHENEEQKTAATAIAEFFVPLVKGYCTEMSVEVASGGIQVHGGMGFIEETGAAQHYRDARILPIYEGTTAIQANDLIGRKILRDKGETARALATMIYQTEQELLEGSKAAVAISSRLKRARIAFLDCVEYLVSIGRSDPNAAFGGGVPFLMLAGNLMAGWQLGRSVTIAEMAISNGDESEFMTNKIATAHFYAEHILNETDVQRDRIIEGADSLMMASL